MSASKEIDSKTLELEVNNGLNRDDFPLKTFINFIVKKNKDIFNNELITYLPFLPMTKQHIKQCIELDLKKYYSEFSYTQVKIKMNLIYLIMDLQKLRFIRLVAVKEFIV
jgi:hypothetical protein